MTTNRKFRRCYIQDSNGNPVESEALTASKFIESGNHVVVSTEDKNVSVSTVFLCFDHGMTDSDPPVLWETMVVRGVSHQGAQRRYSSRADAFVGHYECVILASGRKLSDRTFRTVAQSEEAVNPPILAIVREIAKMCGDREPPIGLVLGWLSATEWYEGSLQSWVVDNTTIAIDGTGTNTAIDLIEEAIDRANR